MSYLDKLSIQGVRSFNPSESQIIDFLSPLTIILGPNGAGKTTIIESLKYVTTGLMPPNSNGGRTFIHDPAFANQTTIRGQVRLRFCDVERKSTTVTKSIESTLKRAKGKTQQTFKQLNAIIKRDNNVIDQRCLDMNVELLNLFGVSKAVISNVIFCHQEDCNWPLSEGKVLKEKFDDIFGSMGYVKALEKIRKLRKTETDRQKLLSAELVSVKLIKDSADEMQLKVRHLNGVILEDKEKINKCENILRTIRSELADINSKEESIQQIGSKISSIEGIIKEKQRALDEIRRTIEIPFNGDLNELKHEISNFEENVSKAKLTKESLTAKQKQISQQYSEMMQKKQQISKDIAKLEAEEMIFKSCVQERSELVLKICEEYCISNSELIVEKLKTSKELNEREIDAFELQIKDHLDNLCQQTIDQKKTTCDELENLNKELSKYKTLKNKCEHEIELWNKDLVVKQKSLQDIEIRSIEINSSCDQRTTIEADIKELREQLQQMEHLDTKKSKIVKLENEKKRLKLDIEESDSRLKKILTDNEERIKLDLMKKEKLEKEQSIKKLNKTYKDLMSKIGAIEGQFQSSLDGHIRNLSAEFEKKSRLVSSLEKELTKRATIIEFNQKQLKSKKSEINKLEKNLKGVCNILDYEDVLRRAEDEVNTLREEISDYNSLAFVKKQIECINTKDCCPVCERSMSEEWNGIKGNKLNKKKVINKLESGLIDSPSILSQKSEQLKEKEKHLNRLHSLRSDIDSIQKLSQEIPANELDISKDTEKNDSDKFDHDKEKSEMTKQSSELDSLRRLLHDASKYDSLISEIKEIDYKINRDAWKFDNTSDNADDVNKELSELRAKYSEIEDQISECHKTISKHHEKSDKLQKAIQSAEQQKMDLERQMQQRIIDEKKMEELRVEIDVLDNNISDSYLKEHEFENKIKYFEENKADLTENFEEFEQKLQTKINDITSKQKEFQKVSQKIKRFQLNETSDEAIQLRRKCDKIQANVSKVEVEKDQISCQINQISEVISSNEVRKRELNDNLKLFTYSDEIEEQKVILNREREKLGFHNLESLINKKKELEKKERKLEADRQQAIGNQRPIISQISELEKKLIEPKFKEADVKYKQKIVDKNICEMAGDDLNKYYKALDYAVTNFHQRKMKEINKLIQGLWKQAYKGLDIDAIKIVSDEDEERNAEKRRTYNYRVVMVKGNSEMDMRGRCSAGQKVLASLIIRLALAEIFCINCSVIALDEPTTNLDKDNIGSFANAISEIVRYRSQAKSLKFQLIIITHDEEFLRCLDDETGQYYYYVSKNRNGYSTICRKSIRDNREENDSQY